MYLLVVGDVKVSLTILNLEDRGICALCTV